MDDIKQLAEKMMVGLVGENHCRNYLKDRNHEFFQVDLISRDKSSGKYYLWEVKHQARFRAPPFDGHGLPTWQIKARLDFYRSTGIRPILYVLDKETKDVYAQAFDVLNDSDSFLTKNKSLVIFPIESFEVLHHGSGCMDADAWQNGI